MDKNAFLAKFRDVYNNPEKYVQVTNELNPKTGKKEEVFHCEKLAEFFNDFVKTYLAPEMEGIVDELPPVTVEKVKKLAPQSKSTKESGGHYTVDSNELVGKIEMNAERFSGCKTKEQLRSVILQMMPIICHEFQHFKQYTLVNANNGKLNLSDEQRAKLNAQFGADPEVIAEDCSYGSRKNVTIDFMKEFDPKIYKTASKQVKPNIFNIEAFLQRKDTLKNAHYFNRPYEVDARETSLKYFEQLITDTEKYNLTTSQEGQVPVSRLKGIRNEQALKNKIDLKKYSTKPMETFDEECKKIEPGKIAEYYEMIGKKYPPSNNPEQSQKRGAALNNLSGVLENICRLKGPVEGQKFLSEVEKVARASGNEELANIAKQTLEEQQKHSGSQSVSKDEIEQTGYYEKPEQQQTQQRESHEKQNGQTLSPEELEEQQQMERALGLRKSDD